MWHGLWMPLALPTSSTFSQHFCCCSCTSAAVLQLLTYLLLQRVVGSVPGPVRDGIQEHGPNQGCGPADALCCPEVTSRLSLGRSTYTLGVAPRSLVLLRRID